MSADVLLEYSVSYVKFAHWAARMLNSDKLSNSLRAENANGCLDFLICIL